MKKARISFEIELDEKSIPHKIFWDATDSQIKGGKEAKAIAVSIWTNEMLVQDMNIFTYQSLVKIADTYQNSTNNPQIAQEIKDFANYLSEKLEIFKK
jgi:gliding motility-associated protein GldC